MQVLKPPHNRYILSCLDNSTYTKYTDAYSNCKRWGVRGIYVFLSGTSLYGVVKEVTKDTIVQYGKRRLATVVVAGASYVCEPAIAVITNATCVSKSCKVVYNTVGYLAEAVEDASHVPFLPVDILVFGQPIPANKEGRFSFWSNITDITDQLPAIESGD